MPPAFRATILALSLVLPLAACSIKKTQPQPAGATPSKKPAPFSAVFGKLWPHPAPAGTKKEAKTKKEGKPKKTPVARAPVVVGTIAVVNREDRFVLIDATAYSAASPGDSLTCLSSAKEVSTVRVSSERRPPFLIADIVAGKPQVGDRVFSPH